MKLSYKQKLYFSVLGVFLVFFNIGIISVASIQNTKNLNMQKETYIQQNNIIVQQIMQDIDLVISTRPQAIPLIIQEHGNYLYFNDIYLFATENSTNIIYSSFVNDIVVEDISEISVKSEIIEIENEKTFIASTKLDDSFGGYVLTTGYSIQWFFDDWADTINMIVFISFIFSAIIALVLYFAITRLTKPLEELTHATSKFGEGDLSARAKTTSNDELGVTAKNFNIMADKINFQINSLQNSTAEKQRLIDDISHEMRTPLTAIRGYIQYMQTTNLSQEEHFENLDIIDKQADRMQKISEGVLSIANLRGKSVDTKLNMQSVLFDIYNSYIIKAKNQETFLEFKYNDNFEFVANRILIESLVGNLIDNALNATINVRYSKVSLIINKNEIIILDNGIGMSKETLENIFQPFYRADKSRSRKSGGAGLGASLVKEICDKYNIKITYYSQLNEGTKTVLTFTA